MIVIILFVNDNMVHVATIERRRGHYFAIEFVLRLMFKVLQRDVAVRVSGGSRMVVCSARQPGFTLTSRMATFC